MCPDLFNDKEASTIQILENVSSKAERVTSSCIAHSSY